MPGWQHEKWISRRFLVGKTVSPLRLVPDSASTGERICSINVSGHLFVFRKGGIHSLQEHPRTTLQLAISKTFSLGESMGRRGRGERERRRRLREESLKNRCG